MIYRTYHSWKPHEVEDNSLQKLPALPLISYVTSGKLFVLVVCPLLHHPPYSLSTELFRVPPPGSPPVLGWVWSMEGLRRSLEGGRRASRESQVFVPSVGCLGSL